MELKNRTLSNFAELVRTGECKKFRGRLKVGVDLGTANTVLAVVDSTNRPIAGVSAPSHAIRDGVIVNYYESVQLVTKLKEELEESCRLAVWICFKRRTGRKAGHGASLCRCCHSSGSFRRQCEEHWICIGRCRFRSDQHC